MKRKSSQYGTYKNAMYRKDVNVRNTYHSKNVNNKYNSGNRVNSQNRGYYSYNSTSLAQKYFEEAYNEANNKPKYVSKRLRKKERKILSLSKTFTTIAIIFVYTLLLLSTLAYNSDIRESIANMASQLSTIEENSEYLRSSINESIDLKYIEQEAIKYGLQKPVEYQLVEIRVPKESFTIQYDTQPQIVEQGFFDYLKSLFTN